MPPKKPQIQFPALKLTVDKGPLSGQAFEFGSKSRIQIGRVVRGNNLSIKDGGISSKHLAFEFDSGSGQWTLTDLMSSNGTILNGVQLEPSEPDVVAGGDVVKIGETTSMRVTFEAAGGGGGGGVGQGGVRRNARRGAKNRGVVELGVIDEDSELGLESGIVGGNVVDKALGSEIDELGLEVENGVKLGDGDDGGKGRGRRTHGSKANVSKNGGDASEVLVEEPNVDKGESENVDGVEGLGNEGVKLGNDDDDDDDVGKGRGRRTRGSKANDSKIGGEVLVAEHDVDKGESENVGGVEGNRGTSVSVRRTRSTRKDVGLSKIEGEELGRQGVVEESRVSVRRTTRSSRKVEEFIDLSVLEGKKKGRGASAREKKNLPIETPLREEKIEEEKTDSVIKDNEPVKEGVSRGKEGAVGVASTSGVKDGDGQLPKGSRWKDLEKMTLGEWFDYLEVALPKQIYDATEELIAEMEKKAKRVHEFKLQQKAAMKKGDK